MAEDQFVPLERWLQQATAALEPGSRKKLLVEIARELRRRNQQRIVRQTGPDGEAWSPRKRNKAGKIRKKAKMLQGMRDIRRLLAGGTDVQAEIGYEGRTARLAEVHQLGLVDAVAPNGPRAKYPARALLGLTAEDTDYVIARIMDEISAS
jgi:phage virion morphogenesis protein